MRSGVLIAADVTREDGRLAVKRMVDQMQADLSDVLGKFDSAHAIRLVYFLQEVPFSSSTQVSLSGGG